MNKCLVATRDSMVSTIKYYEESLEEYDTKVLKVEGLINLLADLPMSSVAFGGGSWAINLKGGKDTVYKVQQILKVQMSRSFNQYLGTIEFQYKAIWNGQTVRIAVQEGELAPGCEIIPIEKTYTEYEIVCH